MVNKFSTGNVDIERKLTFSELKGASRVVLKSASRKVRKRVLDLQDQGVGKLANLRFDAKILRQRVKEQADIKGKLVAAGKFIREDAIARVENIRYDIREAVRKRV